MRLDTLLLLPSSRVYRHTSKERNKERKKEEASRCQQKRRRREKEKGCESYIGETVDAAGSLMAHRRAAAPDRSTPVVFFYLTKTWHMIFLDGDDDDEDEDRTMIQTDRTSFLLRFPFPPSPSFRFIIPCWLFTKGNRSPPVMCVNFMARWRALFFSVSEINYAQLKQFNAIQFKAISLCKYYVCTCTHTGGDGYGTAHQSVIDYVGGKTQMEESEKFL